MKLLLIALTISLGAETPSNQKLVVANDAFYLDGKEALQITALESHYDPDKAVVVEACACVETGRVITVLDWLTEKGKDKVNVKTVMREDQALCGDCQ